MRYQVIYTSDTGNTEKLAKEIFGAINSKDKDIQKFAANNRLFDGEVFFIGFWVKRGTCSMDLLDYISELHGKKIALFGTCGMGADKAYYKRIEDEIKAWIPDDCEYSGAFLCQGKMPMGVRDKYTAKLGNGSDNQIRQMIQNFDNAMTHPDKKDILDVKEFVQKVIS